MRKSYNSSHDYLMSGETLKRAEMGQGCQLLQARSAFTRWMVSLVFLMAAGITALQAQTASNYAFAATSGTYTPITVAGGAIVPSAAFADNVNHNITGLTAFNYNGTNYTSYQMNSNGRLILYTTAPTATGTYTPLSTAITNAGVVIAPFGADLAPSAAATSGWLYQTIGNEIIFQWNNVSRFGATSNDILNFQVRLNTSTGSITFVYGACTIGATPSGQPQVGFRGTSVTYATDVNNLYLNISGSPATCDWSNAVTGQANSSTMYINSANSGVKPSSGLTYTWTRQSAPAPVRTFSAVSSVTASGATVSWTTPTGATAYNVQYRALGSCGWTSWSGNPVTGTSVALAGLAPSTVHQVRVQATNGTTSSIYSHIPNTAGTGDGYTTTGTFTTAAACAGTPSGVSASNVTASAATVSWTAASPAPGNGYTYEIRTSGAAGSGATGLIASGTTEAGVVSFNASALSPSTAYTVYVRTYCGGTNYGSWTSGLVFTTPCASSAVPTAVETFTSASLPACWSSSLISGTTAWATTTSNDGVPSPRTGTYFMGKGYTTSDALVVSQPINMSTSATGAFIDVWIYRSTSNLSSDRIRFYVNNSASLTGATQLLEIFPLVSVAPVVASAGWYNYQVAIPASFNSSAALFVLAQGTTSGGLSSYGIGFDDLSVKAQQSCYEPASLAAVSIASNSSASVSWSAPALGSATGYEYAVSTSSTPPASGIAVSGTSATSAPGSVAINQVNYLHVRANCGSGGYGTWATTTFAGPAVTAIASGDFATGANWNNGVGPVCGHTVVIPSGIAMTVSSGTAAAAGLTIQAGGALTVSGTGALTIGCANNNSTLLNNGSLAVSGGTLTVNGNLLTGTGGSFTQSGGQITIDGNSGTAGTSVPSGTPIVAFGTGSASFATGTISLTGGTLTITDPHLTATSTSAYALYANLASGVSVNAAAAHILSFGDGTSVQAGGNTSGFFWTGYAGSGRLNLGAVVVNNPSGSNRTVTQTGTNAINGNFTVTAGTYDQGTSILNIGGNVSVGNGATWVTGTAGGGSVVFASTTGLTTSAQTIPQSISVTGTGAIRNTIYSANFYNVSFLNSSAGGITINDLNTASSNAQVAANVLNSITFNGKVSTSGKALLYGTTTARGAGSITVTSGGMTPGSAFAIGTNATQTGSSIGGNGLPSATAVYPLIDAAGNSRQAWIERVTPTGSGIIAITYTDASGITPVSITDGAYTVEQRTNGKWNVSVLGTSVSAASFKIAISAPNAFSNSVIASTSARVVTASSAIGTHQAGTTLPNAQRTGLTLEQITTNDFYVGINAGELIFQSVATGNWNDGATWNKGTVPTASDVVQIMGGHTVAMDATWAQAGTASAVTVNTGGILAVTGNTLTAGTLTNNGTINVSGGTLATTTTASNAAPGTIALSSGTIAVGTNLSNAGTITGTGGTLNIAGASAAGVTNSGTFTVNGATVNLSTALLCNRTFSNTGTLTVSSGDLNIFGNISHSGTAFNQSGGAIHIDPNAAGNASNSASSSNYTLNLAAAVNWTGGTLTVADPPASTSSSHYTLYYSSGASSEVSAAHTVLFGDPASSDTGGHANGYYLYNYVGSGKLNFGNVVVNGPASGSATALNRVVKQYSYQNGIKGSLTIQNNGELAQNAVGLIVGGDILVASGSKLTSDATLALAMASGTSSAVGTVAQTITNNGTIANSGTTPTANFTTLTINNSSTAGVTLNQPFSVSGTLTLTAGKVNTTAASVLTLNAAGTLSGGSATAYVDGPFIRGFAAGKTATGTYTAATLFPVGKGSSYLPVYVDPSTSSGGAVTFKAEAFTSNAGTTGAGAVTLSSNRWEALPVSGSANLTNAFIRLSDGAITATNKIIQATSAAGQYGVIVPVSSFTTGSLTTATAITANAYSGYFAYGDLNACAAPAVQPTAFTIASLATTGISASYTAAQGASHYLVVAYPAGNTPTVPADYATPTAAALGTGALILYNGIASSFTGAGLTANTAYDVYVYAYNNSACYGPVFNTTAPLTANFTTCAATVASAGTLTATTVTNASFRVQWPGSSTAGVSYDLDIATDSGYTSFVSGYNGLNVGAVLFKDVTSLAANTTYYVRVRARVGYCSSANTSTTVTTQAVATAPYAEGFATTGTPVGYSVTGWNIGAPTAVPGSPGNVIYKNLYTFATTGTFSTINIGPLPANQQLAFDYRWANASSPYGVPAAGSGTFKVAVSTDFGATYTDLMTIGNDGVAGWKSMREFDLSAYAGMTVKLRISATWASGDYYLAFDNIQVKAMPSCLTPSSMTVSAITSTTANLAWAGTGSNFDVIYGITGFNPASAGTLVEDILATDYQLTNLTEGTAYDVYVRKDCGTDGTSEWKGPYTFRAGYFYTGGNLPTQLNELPSVSSTPCTPEPTMSIQVPAGQRLASLSVKYSITGLPDIYDSSEDDYFDAYMSEQRSMIYSPSLGVGETELAAGVGNTSGTYNYQRGLTFANGATGTITFALRAWRLWGGSGCGTTVQYVNAGSWQLLPVFEPIPSCQNPTALAAAFTSNSTANLTWTAPAATTVVGYEYAVGTSATPPATGTFTTNNSVTDYSGLTAGTTYYLYVRTKCGEDSFSPWAMVSFSSSPCTPSTSFANNISMSLFAAMGYTSFTKTSADSSYSDFTANSVSQYVGQPVSFTAAFAKNSSSWIVGFNVWIDWNGDYDFNDAGENVYTGTTSAASISNSFVIPAGTAPGNYRMRIRSEYNNGNALLNQPCGLIIAGEAEDYTFKVITEPTCFKPTAVIGTATSFTTVNLSWAAPSLGTTAGYEYAVTTSATPPVSGTTVAGTSVAGYSGLTAETAYYVHVRAYCGATNGYSDWVTASFYTGYCSPASTGSTYFLNNFATTAAVSNITNAASGYATGGYGNYSATHSVSQVAGGSVGFTAGFSTGTYGLSIWIDLNKDFIFSASEQVFVSSSYSGSYSASFTVPATAAVGNYRMRVLADFSSSAPSTPCAFQGVNGEAEDYTINVLPPPPAVFAFSPGAICAGGGASISISGANFTGATAVKFNGVNAASFTVNSATSITAFAPVEVTTGAISVTTPDGTGTSTSSLNVNQMPVVADITGGEVAICASSSVQLSNATGGGAWSSLDPNIAQIDSNGNVTGIAGGTATLAYTVTANGCSATKTTTVTVNAPAAVSSVTLSQTVTPGQSAYYTVVATGTGVTYQWELSTNGGVSFAPLPADETYTGVNSATLTVNNVTMAMNGYRYRVALTATPCGTIVSGASGSILNVSNLGITSHPSDVTLCSDGMGTVQFTVAGTGSGLSFQWYENSGSGYHSVVNGLASGVTYSGQGTSTLTLTGVSTSNSGWQYLAELTDDTAAQATSNPATITVHQAVVVSAAPANQVVCASGGTANFTVAATGTGLGYQWQYATSASGPWVNVLSATPAGVTYSGAASATLSVTTTAATPASSYYYRAVISGTTPCGAVTSGVAALSINSLTISSQPVATTVLAGNATSFTVGTSAPAATYQWQYSGNGASWSNIANGAPAGLMYTGSTSASLSVAAGSSAAAGTGLYRVVITSGSCSVTSDAAQLVIKRYCAPAPTSVDNNGITNVIIGSLTNSSTAEVGNFGDYSNLVANVNQSETVQFRITYSTGYTYGTKIWIDWNNDGVFTDSSELVFTGLSGASSPTILSGSFTVPNNALNGYHRLRIGGTDNDAGPLSPCYTGSFGTFEDYTINVVQLQAPVIASVSPSSIACDSGTITVTGSNFVGAVLKIGTTTITPISVNAAATQITATVTAPLSGAVSVSNAAGTATAGNFTATSLPLSLSAANTTLCSGASSGLVTLTAGAADYVSFIWSPASGVSGNAVTGFTFSPSTTTLYTLTASSASGCTKTATLNVIVNSAPSFSVASSASQICSGQVATLSASVSSPAAVGGCTAATHGQYPSSTYTPATCNGSTVNTITSAGYAGEFSVVAVSANTKYTFASSVTTDYITITDGTGANILVSGNTPLVYSNTTAGTVRFYNHTNASCGEQSTVRTRTVICAPQDSYSYTWSPTTGLYTDAAGTSPYSGGAAAVVYAKPATATTYTVTATGAAGCTKAETVTVTVNDKTWTGAVSTNWNNAGNWCGGQVPAATDNVVVPAVANQPVISGNYVALAANVTVAAGASLTVQTGSILNIANALNAAATASVLFENNAHLIQGSAVASNSNSGNVVVKRNSSPLYRQDYTMWSSPVATQNLLAFSPNTVITRFYTYNPVSDQYAAVDPAANSFDVGKGYLIRLPNGAYAADGVTPTGTFTATAAAYQAGTGTMTYNGRFSGVPNSGTISVPLSVQGNGFNLVGNPYPSPISIPAFFAANAGTINGYVYIWRKKNAESVSSAYCTVNSVGDFVSNNQEGANDPQGIIQTGQGFIVKAGSAGNLVFNNAMRSVSILDASFFRMSNAQAESHRIWLNLADATHAVAQMMVGYRANATMGADPMIDAPFINDSQTGLNSLIGESPYAIQGRSLPFDINDEVPLQFRAAAAGTFTISIDHVDGLFLDSQDIFLKDAQTGAVHDLKSGSYTFQTSAGTFNSRFSVVYKNSALGTDTPVLDANSVFIYKNDGKLYINTGSLVLKDVGIFDIRGRQLYAKGDVNASSMVISDLHVEEQMLIVKVTTTDNATATKKIIF